MKLRALLAAVALLAISCSATRLIDVWVPTGYDGPPYKRLMIVGLAPSPAARAQYENDFVDQLSNYNILALASVNLVPDLRAIDRKTVEKWLAEYTLDGVLVTRPSDTKPDKHYVPPHFSLGGWYGAWATGVSPEVMGGEKLWLQTDLFDAETEKLVYSSLIVTRPRDDRTKKIHAVIDLLAKSLTERGYLDE